MSRFAVGTFKEQHIKIQTSSQTCSGSNLAVRARAERMHGIPNDVQSNIPNDAYT